MVTIKKSIILLYSAQLEYEYEKMYLQNKDDNIALQMHNNIITRQCNNHANRVEDA